MSVVLRRRVSRVWLAACVGASAPAVLGAFLRLADALGNEALGRFLYGLIAACVWLPVGLLSPSLEYVQSLSPAQLFLAAMAVDAAFAAGALAFARSCLRIRRGLLAARKASLLG